MWFKDSSGETRAQIENTVWDDFGCWNVVPDSVGQYTGLKDKNGVEIYEGDIVKYSGHYFGDHWEKESIGIVEWNTETASYPWKLTDTGFEDGPDWCEVIGNVHENPDLLEGD
jgi:uncharacterized phage protein (TIGR01671 family)